MRWPWSSCRGCDARDLELGRAREREAYQAKRIEALEASAIDSANRAVDKLSAHADLKAHLADERLKNRPVVEARIPPAGRRITPYMQTLIANGHINMGRVREELRLRRKPAPISRIPPPDPDTVPEP